VTAQGHPRARFRRAIEGGWVFDAELAAREAGNLSLAEALDLVWQPAVRRLDRMQSGTGEQA
jgi:hypothetical protein